MKEPSWNVEMVCSDHASRPNPDLQQEPLEWYVGKYVKIAFPAEEGSKEHMWVDVKGVRGIGLWGILNNDPVMNVAVKNGDEVEFVLADIEAITEG